MATNIRELQRALTRQSDTVAHNHNTFRLLMLALARMHHMAVFSSGVIAGSIQSARAFFESAAQHHFSSSTQNHTPAHLPCSSPKQLLCHLCCAISMQTNSSSFTTTTLGNIQLE